MKKEYIKPSCTEELVTVNMFLLADKSTGGSDLTPPWSQAPKKNARPF